MPNPIGWCDLTINPITGCRLKCPYCYARKMAHRLQGRFGYPAGDRCFEPTMHWDLVDRIHKELPLGGRKRIFLDSMGDWFSEGVEPTWVHAVVQAVKSQPTYTFLVLTKWPQNIGKVFGRYDVPSNLWLGVTVTEQTDTWRLRELENVICYRFVSFEPLHGPIRTDLRSFHWIIIGQETGNRKDKVYIERKWLDDLCHQANAIDLPVYLKNGMAGPRPDGSYDRREEFPEGMV